MVIRAADNGKGGLGLEGSRSEILAVPEFPVLSWSFFWIYSYLNTGEKKRLYSPGSCPCTQQEMIFGLSVWCRIEEALGSYVNERNYSVYG